jgi:hypothetical protein
MASSLTRWQALMPGGYWLTEDLIFVKDVAVMTEEHAPNEDAMKIAEEGIRGMINALGPEAIAPDVMIDAALHILAAWVASSQTNATPGEREADIAELEESLPSYIEYHRSAKWLPEPRRSETKRWCCDPATLREQLYEPSIGWKPRVGHHTGRTIRHALWSNAHRGFGHA